MFVRKKSNDKNLSELAVAVRRLKRAQELFDGATDDSFSYANSELTAATEYRNYVTSKVRAPMGQC